MANKNDDTLKFSERLMNRQDSYLSHLRYYQDFTKIFPKKKQRYYQDFDVSVIYCGRLVKI